MSTCSHSGTPSHHRNGDVEHRMKKKNLLFTHTHTHTHELSADIWLKRQCDGLKLSPLALTHTETVLVDPGGSW